MLEDHDMTDRQQHAHLQPVVLGIAGCVVVILAIGYFVGGMF